MPAGKEQIPGAAAVDLYKKAMEKREPFHAVVMDLTVRGSMGGEKTISRLTEIDPGVKAIVSSGYSTNPTMAEYRKLGFAGVVAKPFRPSDLRDAVRRII